MAKKNRIKIKKNRPSLVDDFTHWISNRKIKNTTMDFYGYDDEYCEDLYGSCFGDWYDQYDDIELWQSAYKDVYGSPSENDDEEYENYWNRQAEKKKEKKRKKSEMRDDDDDWLTDDKIEELIDQKKEIYFYTDIENENSVRKFKTLRKFFNYLDSNSIDMSDDEGSKFIRANTIHCCINPYKKNTLGISEIISDHSYGALAYEVSEDASLFEI